MGGYPCQRVGDLFRLVLLDPDTKSPVVVHRRTDVPIINGMRHPCVTFGRFLVYHYLCVRGCAGGLVKIQNPIYLCVGGYGGGQVSVLEDVECDQRLWDQFIPQVHCKCWVGVADDGNGVNSHAHIDHSASFRQ